MSVDHSPHSGANFDNEARSIAREATGGPWPLPWSIEDERHDDYWANQFHVVDAEGGHIATCEYLPHAELLVVASEVLSGGSR